MISPVGIIVNARKANYDETVRLVITPLNVSTETFLCIYFEPVYDINNSFNDSEERFNALLDRINSNLL